ncbi:uncharacterized protein SCHCODRAFT_02008761 [Schizophyllum commune H4-8]|uniref:uncharacterized protein n=1 Tax=Schizophyllum commune (strain H4-8 / FGSC 9210) TaxID=578458 RepID=UPI00215F33DA|nr:uncharacterized protein SCHCODRAFT_02008761 [Schizophyllum commune H4-8]KAI5899322.1 hypothetical protein SCHCODRAFT_02008761 [Schizophyllum commune H4-8]
MDSAIAMFLHAATSRADGDSLALSRLTYVLLCCASWRQILCTISLRDLIWSACSPWVSISARYYVLRSSRSLRCCPLLAIGIVPSSLRPLASYRCSIMLYHRLII